MAIVIYIVLSLIIFTIIFSSHYPKSGYFTSFRLAYVETFISLALLAWLNTEVLSLFNGISLKPFVIAYLIETIVFGTYLFYLNKEQIVRFEFIYIFKKIKTIINRSLPNYLVLIVIVFIFFPLLYILFRYPPNNYDSLTCWLPRIENWIQNGNVDYFPTHEPLQNIHQPLSSYWMLQIRILSGNDLFLNSIQFLAFIGLAIIVSLIAKQLNINSTWQWIAIIIAILLPAGILESVTTQNDLIISFFFLSCVYYFLKWDKMLEMKYVYLISICATLAALTKVVVLPFLVPVFIFFIIKRIQHFKTVFYFTIIFLSTFSLLHGPYFYRNISTYNSIYGTNPEKLIQGQSISINQINSNKVIIVTSVGIKFIGQQLGSYLKPLNAVNKKTVKKIHKLLGIDIRQNSNGEYKTDQFPISEDAKSNPWHMLLFLASIPFVVCTKDKQQLLFVLLIISSFILFCLLLPLWGPYRGRYFLPLAYFSIIPILSLLFYFQKVKYIIITLLIISAIPCAAFSTRRPLIPVSDWYKNKIKHLPNKFTFTRDFDELILHSDNSEKALLRRNYFKNGEGVWIKNKVVDDSDHLQLFKLFSKNWLIDSIWYKPRDQYLLNSLVYYRLCCTIHELNVNRIGIIIKPGLFEYNIWKYCQAQKNAIEIRSILPDSSVNFPRKNNPSFLPQVVIMNDYKFLKEARDIDTIYSFGNLQLVKLKEIYAK